jgi:hypothetical protein
MDQPSKKRSIFGFTGLFRSPSVPADDRDMNTDASPKPAAPATAQREFNNSASAPHSPMKRASESQIASRRIIGRPQGPSSKLSQSISASDIAHRPSSMVVKRMPGDNPNKRPPVMSASVMSHAPSSNVVPKSTSFSGVTSTPRNLFRSSALYSRPNMQTFSPRVPAASTLNQSFPPNTPGKPPRGSTADVNGRILANTTSTELFKMRIPSPPRHLTGEMLASEVPDDPNRSGSVYADEFLAHYCPPDLDEHQRRQFFCILDLRRLKYAADDVFTKKDWKINILNFAKEYEKSRSLIMLRYGLYEFKTVRASEAVKKEWKQKHGIPDSEDESGSPRVNGTPKRKAEEELTPSSNTLASSVSGSNKRARAPDASVKNKRKADSEPDENHPAKLQKPAAPPSATKSVFESIANNAQAASATPVKSTGKSLFASSTGPQPNGSLGTSVFGAAPKPVGSTNIFGHLSDGSKGSGNEGADEESDTGSEMEEEESEAQDVSQSDEQAASGGVSTPQLFDTKKPATNGMSSASSEAGDSTQGRSIFDRITRGTDGQPIRKVSPSDGGLFAPPPEKERSTSPVKELPAAAPANNTWNAATPIKFAPTAAPAFGSTAQQPAGSSAIDFGVGASKKAAVTPPSEPTKEAAPQTLFGAQTKKADDAAPSAAVNGTTPNLFSSFGAKTADAPAAATPAFGGFGTSTSTGANLFGSAPVFGQKKEGEESKDPKPAAALFGGQPAATAPGPAKANLFQSSTMFGSQNKTEVAPTTQPQFGGLFGKTQSVETEKPAASLFGANVSKPANNLFGSSIAPVTTNTDEPAAKKPAFGSTETKSSSSLFGSASSTPAPESAETKSLFGGASTSAAPATETKSIFSGITAAPATQANSLFGATTPAPAQETKPLFGSTAAEPKPLFGATAGSAASKPIFGATVGATETKPAGLFANPPASTPASSAPIFSFGSSQAPAAPQPAAPQTDGSIFGANGGTSFTFGAGAPDNNTIKNPFSSDGTFSAPSSFNFGSGEAPSTSTSFTFGAGPSNTPTINFGGASDNSAQQSVSFGGPSSGPAFSFGGASQPSSAPMFSQNPPSATPIFSNSLVPGGGTSTGTSKLCNDPSREFIINTSCSDSPFTFGGASSLATTPAATTPEPSANAEDGQGTNADGDDAPQEQISLTDGGPGEEGESAVHEVRAKAVKLVTSSESDDESGSNAKKAKQPTWKTQGVGPLRLLKNQSTGGVRILLRAEPRGHVALNKTVLPNFTYKADTKTVKLTTATDDGKGLETWVLQVKTPVLAQALAEALEEHKVANKK